jgi:hypothetical protein
MTPVALAVLASTTVKTDDINATNAMSVVKTRATLPNVKWTLFIDASQQPIVQIALPKQNCEPHQQ